MGRVVGNNVLAGVVCEVVGLVRVIQEVKDRGAQGTGVVRGHGKAGDGRNR